MPDIWEKSKHFAQTPIVSINWSESVRKIFFDTRNLDRRIIEIGILSFDGRIPRFQVAARMPQQEEKLESDE
jgi:hypothetical protein